MGSDFFSLDSLWHFLPANFQPVFREPKEINTQNDNFSKLSRIYVLLFHWIPLKNSYVDYGNISMVVFTVYEKTKGPILMD